jgi:hypothetical protein
MNLVGNGGPLLPTSPLMAFLPLTIQNWVQLKSFVLRLLVLLKYVLRMNPKQKNRYLHLHLGLNLNGMILLIWQDGKNEKEIYIWATDVTLSGDIQAKPEV